MAIRNALIAVDFDGTVVTHAYPEIGDDAGAVPVLKELTDNGCRLILFTMRRQAARRRDPVVPRAGVPLYAVNENPSQQRWTSSPKVHADLYIDDSSLGCPIRTVDGVKRPVADWTRIRKQLVKVFWTEPPRRRLCDRRGQRGADRRADEKRARQGEEPDKSGNRRSK